MKKKYKVGDVVTGKVTGIRPYGAFVALDESTQGLVHISEITYGYVRNVEDFFKVGDEIQVKILDIDERSDKIRLSTRALQDHPQKNMEKNPKKSLQERVDELDDNGFQLLKEKLQDWIERG